MIIDEYFIVTRQATLNGDTWAEFLATVPPAGKHEELWAINPEYIQPFRSQERADMAAFLVDGKVQRVRIEIVDIVD